MFFLTHDDFEVSVGVEIEFTRIEIARSLHAATRRVAVDHRAEAQIVDRASGAGNLVFVLRVEGRALVVIVRVVGPHLDRRVARAAQLREGGIAVLEKAFETRTQHAGQVAISFGAVERVAGGVGALHHATRFRQRIAKFVPALAARNALFRLGHFGFAPVRGFDWHLGRLRGSPITS